jgi:hypothetical protein
MNIYFRTSIRLQKKRELRQEKKLEELRQQQLLSSQRKSHRRTKRYNLIVEQRGTATAASSKEF